MSTPRKIAGMIATATVVGVMAGLSVNVGRVPRGVAADAPPVPSATVEVSSDELRAITAELAALRERMARMEATLDVVRDQLRAPTSVRPGAAPGAVENPHRRTTDATDQDDDERFPRVHAYNEPPADPRAAHDGISRLVGVHARRARTDRRGDFRA